MPTNGQRFIKMISGFGGCNGAILAERVGSAGLQTSVSNPAELHTSHTVHITPKEVTVDGQQMACEGEGKALLTDLYKRYIDDYPKFYKMDPLCRLGFVASELLLQAENDRREAARDDRAIILFNRSSSIQADEAYQASIQDAEDYFPSPAAFVYTLPNIVTGEIAIRNHYQGETSFYILHERNDELIDQMLEASLGDPSTQSILGGWIDYEDDEHFEARITLNIK
jgi:3-oxoacyl-[acyl-carrier-protein] synthase-1